MMHRATVAGLSALVLAVACSPSPDVRDEPAEPVVLPPARVFDAPEPLIGVEDIALGEHGDVWVVSRTEPFIHHYDSTGRLVGAFGRGVSLRGALAYPYDVMAPSGDDPAVHIWSPRAEVIASFSTAGTPIGAPRNIAGVRIPFFHERTSFGRIMAIERWHRGYLLQHVPPRAVRTWSSTSAISVADLLMLDSTGMVTDTLVSFSTFSGPTRPPDEVLELAPIPLWSICPGGTTVVIDPYGKRILRYGATGEPAGQDTLRLDGAPITVDDINVWFRRVLKFEGPYGPRTEAEFAEVFKRFLSTGRGQLGVISPPAVSVMCDDEDRIWLQRFDMSEDPRGRSRNWVVLSTTGTEQRYTFPRGFQPMAIRDGMAFGVQADSLETERVGVITIRR